MKYLLFLVGFFVMFEQFSFAIQINADINQLMQEIKNGTVALKKEYDYLAPDHSEIRLFPNIGGQGLAHCLLPKSGISKAVTHKTVSEVWEFVKGQGEIWLNHIEPEAHSEIIKVKPGSKVEIPVGTHFQFRNTGEEALEILIVTDPIWPGPDEAVSVRGHWLEPLSKNELNEDCEVVSIPERELTIYSILPTSAGYGYKIEIFDVHQPITDHLHAIQTQYLLVLEGSAEFYNGTDSVLLGPGGVATVPPGAVHHIYPKGHVRFLGVDVPGFDFPEDTRFKMEEFVGSISRFKPFVFTNQAESALLDQYTKLDSDVMAGISPKMPNLQVNQPIEREKGHTSYPLAGSERWSLSLVELNEEAKFRGNSTTSHHLVLLGELEVRSGEDQSSYSILLPGQSAHFRRGVEHSLSPVRGQVSKVLSVKLK